MKPSEVAFTKWTHAESGSYSDIVEDSISQLNATSEHSIRSQMEASVARDESTGLIYSRIASADDSKEAAIAISSPYANGLAPHRLALSALHHEVARRAGFRDTNGNTLPVITIGSPTINHRLGLTQADKENMVEGLARRELALLERQKIGRLALLGFSQGADVSMTAAKYAQDVEVAHVAIGDPARVAERNRLELMRDMTKATIPEIKSEIREGGLEVQRNSFEREGKIGSFVLSSVIPTNIIYMTESLARDELSKDTLSIARSSSVSIGYGSESAITKDSDMQRVYRDIEAAYDSLQMYPVSITRMEEKNHAWGDNARLLANFYFDKMPKSI